MRIVFFSILFIAGWFQVAAQTTEDLAVELSATVTELPPSITLHWKNISFGNPDYRIYKKAKNDTVWGNAIDTLPQGSTYFVDSLVVQDSAYEYQVLAQGDSFTSSGYIFSGIKVPAIHNQGILLLLVDSFFTDSCSLEINTLMNDLSGDGWQIIRHDFARTLPDSFIKATITNDYLMYNDVKAVLIVGHLAVPYSGNIAPDGHLEHAGAWPADIYYGSINSTWTDTSVYDTIANFVANHNIPGDGKWDQSLVPNTAQLQIGRVDFYDMPAFALTEIQLMKQYLNRNHAYKMDSIEMRHRGIICNQFNYSIEGFAANGWRNFAPLLSADSITVVGYYYLFSTLANESFQWAYGCGGGTFTSANGIGTTYDITTNPYNNIFSMLFGSYFGDWNVQNNFLRAPLCATPPALTNCWAGRPNWVFHHMALGENIGYSALQTQNNQAGLYTMPYNYATGGVHVALMGDVSLRTNYIKPVSQMVITPTQTGVSLNWTASPDANVLGYHIFRADSAYGYFTKISDSIVLSTAFNDTNVSNGKKYYMVRPVKLEHTASGNYFNMGVGITDTVTVNTTNVSMNELEESVSISVFPNPATKFLNVNIEAEKSSSVDMFLVNEKGQIQNLFNRQLKSGKNNFHLNISSMAAGTYTLVVKTAEGKAITKWIKL